MGASGVKLRFSKIPFNGVKTEYSKKNNSYNIEDVYISDYKEYIPYDTTDNKVISNFPNNLIGDK